MTPAVYDTVALLAGERDNPKMVAQHAELERLGIRPVVPAVVLAQAWRGGPQRSLAKMLKTCEIRPTTEAVGRLAGQTCAAANTSDAIDAIVVATAMSIPKSSRVFTSDPVDLKHLADSIGTRIQLYVV